MTPRRDAVLVLTGIGLTDLMFRVAQVAVPLVVLAQSGSAALTGLSWGATALPIVLSPWWARGLRLRIRSGRAIAGCYLGEAVALALIPLAATCDALSWPVLLLSGLSLGIFETLDGPARDALIADLGDSRGPDRAFALLSMRDFFRRGAMVAGPVLGGALVTWGDPLMLLWAEVATILVSAALTCGVRATTEHPGVATNVADAIGRIWPAVRARPDVLLGWVVRGAGCALWFAFSLGLALLGVETGRLGALVAMGLAAFGVGSLLGTPLSVAMLRRLSVLPAVCVAWTLTGLAWMLMGLTGSAAVIASVAALSGVSVAVGNGGVTALITRSSAGDERRTLLAGQSVLVSGASATGLLVGGPLLALLGPRTTLVGAGGVLAVFALGIWAASQATRAAPPSALNHAPTTHARARSGQRRGCVQGTSRTEAPSTCPDLAPARRT